ncbi:hypothetical protein FNV43_RR20177 [Rhamnella rubrinervis]|uniref:F-box domain-containing protein n=1 Tax=Rhamnella rubrinervis TaxID=2594499 RepID=A0A8K0GT49_9ROSA|nr:hypothetical protein FNV43_RR20177 [Rhamnella rubrinervis]
MVVSPGKGSSFLAEIVDQGIFSVKESYLASFCGEVELNSNRFWVKLWKASLHERLKIFLWRMMVGIIPVNQVISSRTGRGNSDCPLCESEEESALHRFKDCEATKALAFMGVWGCRLEGWSITSIRELISFCVDPPGDVLINGLEKETLTIGLACLFYYTWNYRNEVVYGGKRSLIGFANLLSERIAEFSSARTSGDATIGHAEGMKENWKPPPKNWLKANTDAAFKDGNAAFALVLRDEQGRVLFLASKIDRVSNATEAEVCGGGGGGVARFWTLVCFSCLLVVLKTVYTTSSDENDAISTTFILTLLNSLLKTVYTTSSDENDAISTTFILTLLNSCILKQQYLYPSSPTPGIRTRTPQSFAELSELDSTKRTHQARFDLRKLEHERQDDACINGLPDDILVRILCLRSLEEAIRTAILSRRWKNLWMNVPKLEISWRNDPYVFRPHEMSEVKAKVNFVNDVMKLHERTTASLEELTICLPLDSKYSDHINKWVAAVKRRQLRGVIKTAPPSSIGLYWLKDLYLRGVNVVDKVIECLFSNSPFIERFCLHYSQKLHKLEIADAPNLKLIFCDHLEHFQISAPNLNAIMLSVRGCPVHLNLYAPSLCHAALRTVHSLMNICGYNMFDYLVKMLLQFCQVNKTLTIGFTSDVAITICETFDFSHQLPELSTVEHLQLNSSLFALYAPFLQKLSIKVMHIRDTVSSRHMELQCLDKDGAEKVKALANAKWQYYSHQHLKEVELIDFIGSRNELEIVLFVLEIAALVETVVIRICRPQSFWLQENILRYKENQRETHHTHSAELLKTLIRPEINVII